MTFNKKEYMKAYRLRNKEKLKEQQKKYHKKYYQEKKEEIKQNVKEYYEKNKDGVIKEYKENNKEQIRLKDKERSKKYRYGEKREELLEKKRKYYWENRQQILEKKRDYSKRLKVKKRVNKKNKERYDNDTQYKLKTLIRSRLRLAVKDNAKSGSSIENLGCTIDELIVHLENQFEEGMTWENHSLEGWHIDHIKPLCQFDFNDSKQLAEACHYTNLQPLWCYDNYYKGGRTV